MHRSDPDYRTAVLGLRNEKSDLVTEKDELIPSGDYTARTATTLFVYREKELHQHRQALYTYTQMVDDALLLIADDLKMRLGWTQDDPALSLLQKQARTWLVIHLTQLLEATHPWSAELLKPGNVIGNEPAVTMHFGFTKVMHPSEPAVLIPKAVIELVNHDNFWREVSAQVEWQPSFPQVNLPV